MSTAQCSKLRLHSPDLVLGLLLYRDNMYMQGRIKVGAIDAAALGPFLK